MTICLTTQDFTCQPEADLLLCALERATQTPWRRVGQNIAVERVEPYRTIVLRGETLQAWQDKCLQQAPFEFQTELFMPLSGAATGASV